MLSNICVFGITFHTLNPHIINLLLSDLGGKTLIMTVVLVSVLLP